MHIHILADWPLPTPYAAAIQFMDTAHALAEGGTRVTLDTGPHRAPLPALLADYGLAPTPLLDVVPLFTGTHADVGWAVRWLRALDAQADDTRHTIVTRGVAGLRVFQALRVVGPHLARRALFEAHRRTSDEVRRPWRRWHISRHEGQAVRAADGVVAVTRAVADALLAAYGYRSPILILPSGTHWTPTLPPRPEAYDTDVICVGKLMARKGLGLLLGALPHLPGCTLKVVSGTPAEVVAMRARADALGVATHVTFTGHVPPGMCPHCCCAHAWACARCLPRATSLRSNTPPRSRWCR